MSPVLIALLLSVGAVALAARLSRPPAPVPFPRPPAPPQRPDIVSARVAAAQDLQHAAEKKAVAAEQAAAHNRAAFEEIRKENADLQTKVRAAEIQVLALKQLTLPTAIELVAEMDSSTGLADDDDDAGGGAAAGYKPRSPQR